MKISCTYCPRIGLLGNTIRFEKLIEDGKEIRVPVCNRCIQEIEVVRKPK